MLGEKREAAKPRLAVALAFRGVQLLVVLLLLGAGELLGRLCFDSTLTGRYVRARYHEKSCRVPSRLLGSEYAPNCQAKKGVFSKTVFLTNELGLRGGSIRDDGQPRILCLGDSSTFGWRVADDETFPHVLEQLLDEKHEDRRYQVINAGLAGYTSYQGLRLLRERGLALRPEIVIIGFGFNDGTRQGDVEAAIAWNDRWFNLLRFEHWVGQNSSLVRFLRWLVPRSEVYGSRRVGPEDFERNLREIVALSRSNRARPFLISFPSADGKPYGPPRQLAAELDVPLLVYSGPRQDIVHPTVEGYRRFARRLFERLEEEGYLVAPGRRGSASRGGRGEPES